MNVRRGILAAAAAWLVVVVLGSTLAWAVISRAGDEVGNPSNTTTGAAPTTTADPKPTGRSGHTRTPEPTTSSPTTDPTTAGSPGSPAPVQPPVRRTRTWQGLGGLVVVECRGKVARLVGAQADAGFHVEVEDRGPGRVEVEFEGREDSEGKESRVRAFCVNGAPVFDVETDD